MSASWPSKWQGTTKLDCGQDGSFVAVVSTEGQPSAAHLQNFEAIMSRWQVIWPECRQIITDMIRSYGRAAPDWRNVKSVHIDLSKNPIHEDAEWSVGIVFSGGDTLWALPYEGWVAFPSGAQAFW